MKPAIVLYARDIAVTRGFYESLGLTFAEERHGDGPIHFSHDFQGIVLEIYPLKDGVKTSLYEGIALVFYVDDLAKALKRLEPTCGPSKTLPRVSAARTASVRDPDGRIVRLIEHDRHAIP